MDPTAPPRTTATQPRLRPLAGDVAWYGLATAAGPFTAILTVPFLARRLGPAGFGRVDLFVTLTAVAGMVATLGMDGAAARSWFEEGASADRRRRVIATATRVVAAVSGTVAAAVILSVFVMRLMGHPLHSETALIAAFGTFPLITTQTMLREGFRLAGRRAWYVGVAASAAVTGGVAAVVFVIAGFGPAGYFVGLGFGAVIGLAAGAAGDPPVLRAKLDRQELRIMLRFGLPLVPASISMWVLLLADRSIVSDVRGVAEVGFYGLASRTAAPLFLAVQAFQIAWTPFALRSHRDAPAEEPKTRGRAATLVLAASTSVGIGLVIAATPIVRTLGGPRFDRAAAAVLPLCVAWIAYAASAVGFIAFSIERRTLAVARTTALSAVVGVALSLVLVPTFGFVGAAWATAVSYVVLGILALLTGQRISPAHLEGRRLAAVGAIAAGALAGAAAADRGSAAGLVRVAIWSVSALVLGAVIRWPLCRRQRR